MPVLQDGGVLAAAVAKTQALGTKIAAGIAYVGAAANSPESRALTRLISLYERAKDADGLVPWAALQKVLTLTASEGGKFDAALADFCDVAMPEIYRSAINADGTVDLSKVPTIEQLYQVFGYQKIVKADGSYYWLPSRTRGMDLENHHSAVQAWAKALFRDAGKPPPTQAQLDSMPAIMLRRLKHRGEAGGTSAFHQVLQTALPYNSTGDPAVIMPAMEKAYSDWDKINGPTYWAAAKQWLSNNGIQ